MIFILNYLGHSVIYKQRKMYILNQSNLIDNIFFNTLNTWFLIIKLDSVEHKSGFFKNCFLLFISIKKINTTLFILNSLC